MAEFAPGYGEPWDEGSIPWANPAEWRTSVSKPEPETPAITELDLHRIGDLSLNRWFMKLTHDEEGNPIGHLRAPSSRYGSTRSEIVWWALALGCVYQHGCGDPDDPEAAMDGYIGLIVNDHDGAAELLREFLYAVPGEVLEYLGGEEEARRIVGEHVPED